MKKSKKFLSVFCAVCMILAMSAPVFAADSQPNSAERGLAYMDINSAPAEMQEDILAARAAIIFGDQAWTVGGAVSIFNLDGTVEALPEFSDLFPGWDVPAADKISVDSMPMVASASIDDTSNQQFKVADSFKNSEEFYTFTGIGDYVGVYAMTYPSDSVHYNIGFSNASSGTNLGWIPNLSVTQGAKVNTKSNVLYGIRGSVTKAADAGWYYMKITSDPDVIGNFLEPNL
ncbi:hypothetical protein [Intestinimonas butyriciproducens]|uniref:hypothetical protein n=1 Tax=Intestinimonas butyriciproducens TaxID=1297617 RepID=UPI00242FFDAB|nr:hypothetical protein [Intestinimonas butyriciproducens]MCI6362874.1 hypothetical protein [Intestinimonas butyriciproducens]MDY3018467.1 hypothetical protein [Oscillospiraceae bacterium]